MIKLIEFDFDGTLVDTEGESMIHWIEELDSCGVKYTKEDLAKISGSNRPSRIVIYRECFSDQEAYQKNKEYLSTFHPWPRKPIPDLLNPHVPEVLEWIHQQNIPMVITTNSSPERVWEALEQMHLKHYFQDVYSGWEMGHNKPDPYIYKHGMEVFGVQPSETLVVEDAKAGLQGARDAGAWAVALKDKLGFADQSLAHQVMNDMEELPAIIESLSQEPAREEAHV